MPGSMRLERRTGCHCKDEDDDDEHEWDGTRETSHWKFGMYARASVRPMAPESRTAFLYTDGGQVYLYIYMHYTAAIESEERHASATVTFIQFIH